MESTEKHDHKHTKDSKDERSCCGHSGQGQDGHKHDEKDPKHDDESKKQEPKSPTTGKGPQAR